MIGRDETDENIDTKVSGKFTRLYIIALSAVALLSIGGQILVQVMLNEQSSDAKVINIAGRQRMLSQKICKNVLMLEYAIDTTQRVERKAELDEALAEWYMFHTGLQTGNLDTSGLAVNNSDTILTLFKKTEPHFLVIYNNAQALSKTLAISTPEYRQQVTGEIMKEEKLFLQEMDKIVFTYASEAKERVHGLMQMEVALLLITLVILVLEGMFIFKPAVARLRKTMLRLVESEAQANRINEELSLANHSLKKTEEELLNSTNEKYRQQLNEQKIRATSLVEGQESERNRIARDIHDGVGQILTALKLNIESISSEQLPDKEKTRLEEARKLISKTIAETRTITFNLMPTVLSDYGIVSALKQLTDQASRNSEANVVLICPNPFSRLDKNLEIGIYRISQEAINNALKYAQAKEIVVELLLNNNSIYLTIIDNGKGFNSKKTQLDSDHKKISNGIYNMQERTNLLDGEFKISSAPGKGTKIWAQLPVKYQ